MASSVFTFKMIRTLKPKPKRYDRNDRSQPGLIIRVAPTGSKVWIYRFTWKDKRPEITIGHYPSMSLAEAREIAATMRAQVRKGIDPRKDPASPTGNLSAFKSGRGLRFSDCFKLWENHHALTSAESVRVRKLWWRCHINPLLGSKHVSDLRRVDAYSLMNSILDKGNSKAYTMQIKCFAGQIIESAISRGHDLNNCFARVPLKRKKNAKTRTLSNSELDFIWNHGPQNPDLKYLIRLILLTGNRTTETMLAKWEHIDLTNRVWMLPVENVKNRTQHEIPFDLFLAEQLAELRALRPNAVYLFPHLVKQRQDRIAAGKSHSDLPARLRDFLKRRGIVDRFCFHDMRRTAAKRLKRMRPDGERVPKNAIRCVLNHRGVGDVTDQHYTGDFDPADWWPEHKAALVLWSDALRAIVDPRPVGTKAQHLRVVA